MLNNHFIVFFYYYLRLLGISCLEYTFTVKVEVCYKVFLVCLLRLNKEKTQSRSDSLHDIMHGEQNKEILKVFFSSRISSLGQQFSTCFDFHQSNGFSVLGGQLNDRLHSRNKSNLNQIKKTTMQIIL